ncbi:hypothetical protein [Herpetosiphon giganteus]|uniref:hypothetical protein n=1 Tax=Herpetosiphon giganteus TaxID=2029754 RepID=UPI0019592EC7|nr:hypothetical protein [Herpetosiphon giganteus]MBM7843817.1 MFS family permease [Herpetosiphon giganteus]
MKRVVPTQSIHITIPYLILGLILLIQAIAIYLFNDGKLVYNLDDPYIHLSLARNIAHGHYGINLIEPSAPSSSILWPFILAIFARLPLFEYMPLLLNIGFGVAILYFLHKIVTLIFHDRLNPATKAFLISVLGIVASISPLVWSGMEHLLQILLAVIILYHLLELEINNTLNRWLLVAVIMNGFVRYESLAISIPVLLFIFLKGHRRAALLGLVLTLVPIAAFSYFLHRLGLGYLPTSVIIKGAQFSDKTSFEILLKNLGYATNAKTWYFLLVIMAFLLVGLRQKTHIYFRLTVSLSILLQALFGTFLSSYYRYESYMIIYALLAWIFLYKEIIVNALNNFRKYLLSVVVIAIFFNYFNHIIYIFYTPMMSHSIYSQQYQMALFGSKYYNKNIGVNDLGLVSYMDNDYTLDLFGLSNIEVIDYRKTRASDWMNTIADKYNVDLIMIYDEWFTNHRPNNWNKIGELRTNLLVGATALDEVDFYVRNSSNVGEVRQLLKQFSQTLPANTEFVFEPE